MKNAFSILVFVALAAAPLHGFRPFSDESEDLVTALESKFQAVHQVELYQASIFQKDGTILHSQLLLFYQYDAEEVNGLWRVLPGDGFAGATLLSLQGPDYNPPRLFYKDGARKVGSWVEGEDKRQRLGPSGWNLEDIYDDDKEDWNYTRGTSQLIGNAFCSRIDQSYRDPILRRESAYGSRRVFISAETSLFKQSDYLDREGRLIKSLMADNHVNLGTPGSPRYRARTLIIRHFIDGSTTVLTLTHANYECELPSDFFTQKTVRNWDEEDDANYLNLVLPLEQVLPKKKVNFAKAPP
jgi:hypothetical protein